MAPVKKKRSGHRAHLKSHIDEALATKKNHKFPKFVGSRCAIHVVQAEINKELYDTACSVAKKKNVRVREVVEWAFKAWLLQQDPKTAERLGITCA